MQLSTLASFLIIASSATAQFFAAAAATPPAAETRKLNVTASATFVPEQAGPKPRLINGIPTKLNVRIVNLEPAPIIIELIGGALLNLKTGEIVKNLTSLKLGIELATDLVV